MVFYCTRSCSQSETLDIYITWSTQYVVWNFISVGLIDNNLGPINLSNLISPMDTRVKIITIQLYIYPQIDPFDRVMQF